VGGMADPVVVVRETLGMPDPVRTHPREAAGTHDDDAHALPAWSSATIALVATPVTARSAIPFLSVLGLGRSVVSWQQLRPTGRRPDAYVATRVELLPGLVDAPAAVFVGDRESLRAAARQEVAVALTKDQRLLDHGAVLVPRGGVDVYRWTARTPAERAEMRRELGLPEHLAVAVDHPHINDDVVAALSLAAAAVVTGPLVPLALALGTPVVTSPVSAERLGLHPELEVEVVAGRRRADVAARELAADLDRAGERSRRGRRFAEHHLDLGHAASIVASRLGLPAVEGLPAPHPTDLPTAPVPVVVTDPAPEPERPRFEFAWPEEADGVFVSDTPMDHDEVADHEVFEPEGATVDLRSTTTVATGAVLRPTTIDLAARRSAAPSP
jgi:hypothetical protein